MIQEKVIPITSSTALHTPAVRAPIASISSYYRSKVFTPLNSVNPLVASASVLLSLASKLQETPAYQDIHALYQHLVHEIKSFETHAQNHGYRAETILIARYLLCALLDESILKTPWGHTSGWENLLLLQTFQNESEGQERFFIILDRLREEPVLHIDVLELIYLCLSLGFEGKYQHSEAEKRQLDKIADELYQLIRYVRGDIKKQLLITPPQPHPRSNTLPVLPAWIIITFTFTVLLMVYAGFTFILMHHTHTIFRGLEHAL